MWHVLAFCSFVINITLKYENRVFINVLYILKIEYVTLSPFTIIMKNYKFYPVYSCFFSFYTFYVGKMKRVFHRYESRDSCD